MYLGYHCILIILNEYIEVLLENQISTAINTYVYYLYIRNLFGLICYTKFKGLIISSS